VLDSRPVDRPPTTRGDPLLHRTRGRTLRRLGIRALSALRTASYRGRASTALQLVGPRFVRRYRLRPPPEGKRRLDLGSGAHPRPGYIHIDTDPASPHLEFLVSGYRLPLPEWWADEINATHMLEHVPPPQINRVLREWFRVLRPGGILEVHVPNARPLAEVLLDDAADTAQWAAQNAIFGYWAHPADVRGPEALSTPPDHTIVFTPRMLEEVLTRAGFEQVRDVTGENPCRHLVDWTPYIPRMCLEVTAKRPLE
jgi:predicted SAM-dependent methyltransferase